MANDEQPTIRVRINVGRTASGKTTWDTTVELERPMLDRPFKPLRTEMTEDLQMVSDVLLSESNRLQRELNLRYPQDAVEGAA